MLKSNEVSCDLLPQEWIDRSKSCWIFLLAQNRSAQVVSKFEIAAEDADEATQARLCEGTLVHVATSETFAISEHVDLSKMYKKSKAFYNFLSILLLASCSKNLSASRWREAEL